MHLGTPLAPVLASAGFTARVPTRPGPAGPTLAAQESTGSSILLAWTRVDRCKSSSDRDAWQHHAVALSEAGARRRSGAPAVDRCGRMEPVWSSAGSCRRGRMWT